MRKRLQALLLVFSALTVSACGDPETEMAEFKRAIAYEYKTCQMTHLMTQNLAAQSEGEVAVFWQAYSRLYAFNRSLYEPLAADFGVSNTPGAVTRFRGWISSLAGRWFPTLTIAATQRLANKYVVKLRRMRDIGPQQHRAFLDYVVQMEEVQVSFLADAVKGDYQSAGIKVDNFITGHTNPRP